MAFSSSRAGSARAHGGPQRDRPGLAHGELASRSASRPTRRSTPEAVVQVYGARTWGWRGNFGVHTWVAVKPAKARAYTVYEVIGWRLRWADSVVAIHAARAGRALVRQRAGALRRQARRGSREADSAHRRRGALLSAREGIQRLAGAELQHLRRLDHARGAGTRRRPAADRDRQGLPGRRPGRLRAQRPRRAVFALAACSRSPRAASKAWKSICSG